MATATLDDGVLEVHRHRIRTLSDRLLFTRDRRRRDSLRVDLRTEIDRARSVRDAYDPTLCPRCLERHGRRTEETAGDAYDLYSCKSCGQVWAVKRETARR